MKELKAKEWKTNVIILDHVPTGILSGDIRFRFTTSFHTDLMRLDKLPTVIKDK